MGMVWAMNGKVIPAMKKDNIGKPLLSLKKGKTHILRWRNDTSFAHPIHLHGHAFHLISTDGEKLAEPLIMDTLLINSNQYVDVASSPTIRVIGRCIVTFSNMPQPA